MILIIATRNLHKVAEIKAIAGPHEFASLTDFPGAPSVVEDAGTFAGNATRKAVEVARFIAGQESRRLTASQRFVLADDSGLEVDALNGAPGIYSARFAGIDRGGQGNSSDAENRAKLLRLLESVPQAKRTARFRCVLALTPVLAPVRKSASPVCQADEFELQTQLFDGVCEGRIISVEKGQGGFGYDSLFVPLGYEQTFGELSPEIKNKLSHRAKALEKLSAYLRKESGEGTVKKTGPKR
jgi:XTP/dITP diphosphohydrolase